MPYRASQAAKATLGLTSGWFLTACGGRVDVGQAADGSIEARGAESGFIEPMDASGEPGPGAATEPVDAQAPVDAPAPVDAQAPVDAPAPVDASDGPCTSQIRSWARTLPTAGTVVCTVVVRIDRAAPRAIGHKFICAPSLPVSEAAARARASRDTGFPVYNEPGNIADPRPVAQGGDEMFVLFEQPSDVGSITAVHAVSGQTLFGGGMVWGGAGQITYPKAWDTADVSTCSEETIAEVGSPLDVRMRALSVLSPPDDPRGLLKLVWETGLPAALVHGSPRRLRNAVLFTYRPTVADPRDPNAEEFVFVSAGPE